jgi:hypothetical protein
MNLLKQLIAETEAAKSKKDLTDIFLAGKEAAYSKAAKKNPHEIFSKEWNAWEDGYRSGKSENTFEAEEDDNWQNMDAEDMFEYAGEHLSENDFEALIDELQGLHIEDVEDHEEAIQIMSRFLKSRLQEAEEDDNWPKLISRADEFRVEMDKDEQVHLLDGEGTIRVSMPLVIWKQLCR